MRWSFDKKLVNFRPKPHAIRMRRTNRLPRLCSWSLGTASALVALMFCASASAESADKNVVTRKAQPAAQPKRVVKYYVHSSASAIPLPIEQLAGPFPSTAHAMQVIGRQQIIAR